MLVHASTDRLLTAEANGALKLAWASIPSVLLQFERWRYLDIDVLGFVLGNRARTLHRGSLPRAPPSPTAAGGWLRQRKRDLVTSGGVFVSWNSVPHSYPAQGSTYARPSSCGAFGDVGGVAPSLRRTSPGSTCGAAFSSSAFGGVPLRRTWPSRTARIASGVMTSTRAFPALRRPRRWMVWRRWRRPTGMGPGTWCMQNFVTMGWLCAGAARAEGRGRKEPEAGAGVVPLRNVGGGGEVGRGRCGANERVGVEEGRGNQLEMGHERASYDVELRGEETYDIARPALAHRHDRRAILALIVPPTFLSDELVDELQHGAGHGPALALVAPVERLTSRPGGTCRLRAASRWRWRRTVRSTAETETETRRMSVTRKM